MKVEQWVTRRYEEVAARVAAHGVVASGVDTQLGGSRPALHGHLEVPDVLVLENEAGDGGGVGPLLVGVVGQIALEAARVVGFAVAVGNGGTIVEVEGGGAEVDLCKEIG